MKNIGIITGNLKQNQTGLASYAYNLIDGLKNTDEVRIIRHKDGDDVSGCNSIIPKYRAPYWYLSWSRGLGFCKNQFKSLDLVHNAIQYPISPSISDRYVISIMDLIPILYPKMVTPIYAAQSKFYFPKILKSADQIIAISNNTKQDIINWLKIDPDKIHVTHLGVSEKFHVSNEEEITTLKQKYQLKDPFILFVGALEPKKNIPTLIKAFHLCLKKEPSLNLVIAGRKSWKYEAIFQLINDLNLQSKVRYLNFIPYDDLPSLYSAATAFVFPSSYEGFGFPPLEAMKCGTPVIVSNRSSLPEVVGPRGLMVDPENYHELSEMILKLIQDESFRLEMRDYYLDYAKQFTWERTVKQTEAVYDKVLKM